ncbi:MerR family transcriptional regulator, partial [Corynebacterium sanguinis]
MRISDVAHAAGCSVRAIRYLHTTGAVDEPKRTGANYRDYSLSDVAAILRARALVDAGVPVNQIKQPGAVGRALNLIEERIATLLSQRDRLIALSQTDVGVPADIRRDLGPDPCLVDTRQPGTLPGRKGNLPPCRSRPTPRSSAATRSPST